MLRLLRFRLFQRHRLNRTTLEEIAGHPVLVLPDVFHPKFFFTTEFLLSHLEREAIDPGARVLDMGTGCGIAAIVAARRAEKVVAVDCNPAAVRCARINVVLNDVEGRLEVLEGDLFAPVIGLRFDLILFNPPYFAGQPKDLAEQAFRSDDMGRRFASEVPCHLKPNGSALVVLSSIGQLQHYLDEFRENGLTVEEVARQNLVSETLHLYRLTAMSRPRQA